MITETVSPEQLRDQMDRLEEKLDRVLQYTHNLESRVEGLSEFKEDFVPIMNDAAKLASHKLLQMEAAGTLGALAGIGRSLTKPELMGLVHRVLHAALDAPEAGAKAPGLLRSMRDPEVRRGMTVLLSVLRELGAGPSSPSPSAPALPPHTPEP
ncbi:MAG TPA: DUF1641 domain-containing protein [Longimicrobiales bacterium]|nr:DUF1641 domain-containing protein [Longimicrobiales bacterium]